MMWVRIMGDDDEDKKHHLTCRLEAWPYFIAQGMDGCRPTNRSMKGWTKRRMIGRMDTL